MAPVIKLGIDFILELFTVFILTSLPQSLGHGNTVIAPDGASGTLKFGGPPDLNDETASSLFVPDHLKCDACRAIAYQMWNEFTKFNEAKKSYKFNLPESELIDLIENICIGEAAWKEYGLKEVNGVPHLSGPGLETADTPGVTALGGKWPGRLRDMCESFIGDLGETAIYKIYRSDPKKSRPLEDYMCFGREDSGRGLCRSKKRHSPRHDL